MSQKDPGTIRIVETESREFEAKEVELHVTVRGSSFFVGDAALTKAREVSALVTDLQRLGIEDDCIRFEGVKAEVSSGTMGRNSSASYLLQVVCRKLEMLPDVLGAVTSQKNTKITHLRWEYGDTRETEEELLDLCIERANKKVRRIASALGVSLLGISDLKDSAYDEGGRLSPEQSFAVEDADLAFARRSRAGQITLEDFGGNISHTKRRFVSVAITYRVSDIAAQPAEPSNG